MCMIVDANRMADFLNPTHEDSEPIHKWLMRGGKIVYSNSGSFESEVSVFERKLVELVRDGKAILIPEDKFRDEEEALRKSNDLQSDDPHVLALARCARVRLLYTGDSKLISDFKCRKLISNPRGKIYSGRSNEDLLDRSVCNRKQISNSSFS